MIKHYNHDLDRKPDESEMNYIQRMCATKDINGLSWRKLAELLNNTLGYSHYESYYRKHYQRGDFIAFDRENVLNKDYTCNKDTNEIDDCTGDCKTCDNLVECLGAWKDELADQESRSRQATFEMQKTRVKLNDERIQNQAYIRRLAREETIKEIAISYAQTMTSKKLLSINPLNKFENKSDSKEGILLLSDWHYGMICDNPWNYFDPDVCKNRVRKLLDKVIEIVDTQQIPIVTVLNLSDLIAGRIHTQIRIESRFDVITQTMEIAEVLAEFLAELSQHCKINYYDCLDNHSRLEPNKNDSIELESLVRIIPWYLKERFKTTYLPIKIFDNEFGADIITCKVLDHNIVGVHGDNDRPTTALDRLSLMTHRHYDMLCTAHLHHFSADEQHQSVVISNSSLMGVDSYAEKLRLTSDPSQTFIISTKENVCDCLYRIKLN